MSQMCDCLHNGVGQLSREKSRLVAAAADNHRNKKKEWQMPRWSMQVLLAWYRNLLPARLFVINKASRNKNDQKCVLLNDALIDCVVRLSNYSLSRERNDDSLLPRLGDIFYSPQRYFCEFVQQICVLLYYNREKDDDVRVHLYVNKRKIN
jgi:hypothetical protein